jgi:hypothetical protein
MGGLIDSKFDEKIKGLREPGTSRTGNSRTTIPGFFADIMFGKAPEKK